MNTTPLDVLATPRSTGPGLFSAEIPDRWQQGRGAFGGLVLAMMVRAIEHEADAPGRAVRSVCAQLFGAVTVGPATLRVTTLRVGSGVSTLRCELTQESGAQCELVAVLGQPRPQDLDGEPLDAPKPASFEGVEPVPVRAPLGPVFAQWFEYRPVEGLPFGGRRASGTSGWIRPLTPGERRDPAYLIACMDAWWPVLMTTMDSPRPIATVAFALHLTGEAPPRDEPLFFRARELATHDGFSLELRELWSPDGRLLAHNQQTIALIR